jgi:hypothetical protein
MSLGGPPSHPGPNCFARSTKILTSMISRSGRCGAFGSPRAPRQGHLACLCSRRRFPWRSKGAPAVEGYPVDNRGEKVDLTMAYVGTRKLFEDSGFVKAADTGSVSGGFPRVLMRLDLR